MTFFPIFNSFLKWKIGSRQSEISNLDIEELIYQNVLRLNVSMDDIFRV